MPSLINAFDPREQLQDRPRASLLNGAPAITAAQAPTPADAYDYNAPLVAQHFADQWKDVQDPAYWRRMSQEYGNALIMGSTAPGLRGGGSLDNPAFAKWFGKSKMVDDTGAPIVAYHGTADSFGEFKPGHPNAKDTGWLGQGSYFWNEPGLAGDYATMKAGDAPNIMPVHLKLENPYQATLADKERIMLTLRRDPEASAKFTASLQAKGYDGVVLDYPDKPGLQEIVAFDPSQVKSAIGNRGTFSPTDPRITYGVMGVAGGGAAATQGSE